MALFVKGSIGTAIALENPLTCRLMELEIPSRYEVYRTWSVLLRATIHMAHATNKWSGLNLKVDIPYGC